MRRHLLPAIFLGLLLGACGGEVEVPSVVGKTAMEARAELEGQELAAEFSQTPSNEDRCRITEQDQAAGEEVEKGTPVLLTCVVAVPRVVGKNESAAQEALSGVGLTASFVGEPVDADTPTCRVKSQPSKPVPPDTDVVLPVRCRKLPPPPPPEPEPAPEPPAEEEPAPGPSSCDPNYSGCVPPYPPDVDCADVDGPVTVKGSDPHGLDRDGDGSACEAG